MKINQKTNPIGYKLQKYRNNKAYSQMDVAIRMNQYGSTMAESAYAKVEQGSRHLDVTDLVILQLILDFSYEDLFADIKSELLQLQK